MDLNTLRNMLLGKSVDEKALLALEQEKLAKLKKAAQIAKERQEVRNQLQAARKESKELEEVLGKRSSSYRLMLYVSLAGGLIIIVLIMKSCL